MVGRDRSSIEVGASELSRCFRVLERELLKVVDIEEIWVIERPQPWPMMA